jgi:hypothetical protein
VVKTWKPGDSFNHGPHGLAGGGAREIASPLPACPAWFHYLIQAELRHHVTAWLRPIPAVDVVVVELARIA